MRQTRRSKLNLAELLRQAIGDSGLSPYRVATDAKVDRAVMTRFLNGERGINLDTASRICGVLGLTLTKRSEI